LKHLKLNGLVLSGGKSTRMGMDKGVILYHGIPQREYLYNVLTTVCENTYWSIREDQRDEFSSETKVIIDENKFRGPFNGLLSAHHYAPEAAWLVVACDLPLLDLEAVQQLISQRDSSKLATAFATKESRLPEPLCAIWEPKALKQSISYLNAGNGSCPRKFLMNSDIKLVYPEQDKVLLNANSIEEYKDALQKINTVTAE